MEIDVVETSPAEVAADVLAFAVPEPVELPAAGQELDRLVDGGIQHLIEDGELKGDRGRVTLLHTRNTLKAHRLAAAGVGGDGDSDSLRTAAAAIARKTGEVGGKTAAWILGENGLPAGEQARAVVDGFALGPYDAGMWKTKNEHPVVERLVSAGRGRAGSRRRPGAPTSSQPGRTGAAISSTLRQTSARRPRSPISPRRPRGGSST